MQTEADKIIEEVEEELPTLEMLQEHKPLFGDRTEFLQLGMGYIMQHACVIRRSGAAGSRAEAIELSFDHLLAKTTRKQAERLGEVRLNRVDGIAEALCYIKPIGRSRGIRLY